MWWVEAVMRWVEAVMRWVEAVMRWVEAVMRCDEDALKNVSLTCYLIYYDEDVLRVCWNKSCDEVCENVLTYCS